MCLGMEKRMIFVDMDGVLCDFVGRYEEYRYLYPDVKFPQSIPGFFSSLIPIEGALEAFRYMEQRDVVAILTRPSWHNLNCYTEKAEWVREHLGLDAQSRMIIAPDKSLLCGHGRILIDDTDTHGQKAFGEGHLMFGTEMFPDWDSVLSWLYGDPCHKEGGHPFHCLS
jgi:5'-nucleotidase